MVDHNSHRRAFFTGYTPQFNQLAIFPPWSLAQDQFIETCEACDRCRKACPEKIIYKGKGGFPEVDFTQGECTFCGKCLLSCQSSAFIQQKKYRATEAWPEKHAHILATCLSLNAIMCRSCADYCEADAIQFQLKLKGVAKPIISTDKCTACGACIHACPNHSIEIVNHLSNTEQSISTEINQ
jgi:ferredoxin-type protein NapF